MYTTCFDPRPTFDERDTEILQAREAAYNARQGPRVGDFIRRQDGQLARFSHDWGDGLQSSAGGSFYLGNGYGSFSGSLDPMIPQDRIQPTGELLLGWFWFFHHDFAGAGRGVNCEMLCRVYREI